MATFLEVVGQTEAFALASVTRAHVALTAVVWNVGPGRSYGLRSFPVRHRLTELPGPSKQAPDPEIDSRRSRWLWRTERRRTNTRHRAR